MINFYGLSPFSKYDKTPLYIFGESYGGHYVPAFGQAVTDHNANDSPKIPLKGLGIGDGLVSVKE